MLRQHLFFGIAVAATALFLASSCGASPSAPPVAGSTGHGASTSSPSSGAGQRTHAWLAYAACLRQHGANEPDPTFDQNGNPQFATSVDSLSVAARKACQGLLQGVSINKGSSSPPTAAQLAALTKFAQCVRQHGIPDFPDPDPRTGSFSGGTWNKQDPAFPAARNACKQLLPPSS